MDASLRIPDYLKESTHKDIELEEDVSPSMAYAGEDDELAFMESFDVADISAIKASLKRSDIYSTEQIEEIVSGLDTV